MRQMKWAVAAAFLLMGGQSAFAMWCGGPGSTSEAQHHVGEHACYELFFNNSGGALTSGTVVVLDRTGTGVNVGVSGTLTAVPPNAGRNDIDVDGTDGEVTNIGTYITTTTTEDLETVVGVIDDNSCADQTYCRAQVKGPRLTRCAGATDNWTSGDSVGTSTVAGQAGDAANDADGILGVAISACTEARDNSTGWVDIRPQSNE